MPTQRAPLHRDLRVKLTPQTVRLFLRIESIIEDGEDREWEPAGRRRQCLDAEMSLRRMLGISLGDISPTDPELRLGGVMPDYMSRLGAGRSWPVAVRLRARLLEAAAKLEQQDAAALQAALEGEPQ
jgi:hypothetical protein